MWCACRPTTSTSRSTSTRAPSSTSVRPPSCAPSSPISRSSPNCTQRLAPLTSEELKAVPVAGRDHLTRWAVDYLTGAKNETHRLDAMLEAALERKYSASPGESFFTGGGLLTFENFDPADNGRIVTVREGLQRSVNLLFIRLMRDIVYHTMFNMPSSSATLLDDDDDPQAPGIPGALCRPRGQRIPAALLPQVPGQERDRGRGPAAAGHPAARRGGWPRSSARSIRRRAWDCSPSSCSATCRKPKSTIPRSRGSTRTTRSTATTWPIAATSPACIRSNCGWSATCAITRARPCSRSLEASRSERQNVYGWLFKTRRKGAQDSRIRTLVELEAFLEIHKMWKRLGYPFDSLVPSYATALGSSADRPAALAELMGILRQRRRTHADTAPGHAASSPAARPTRRTSSPAR